MNNVMEMKKKRKREGKEQQTINTLKNNHWRMVDYLEK